MRITSKFIVFGAVAALTAAPILSVPLPHPNHDRGFEVGKAYRIGEIDSISVMNGGLVLTIPIGQEYPAGAGLSTQLALVWNTSLWDFEVFLDDDPLTAEIEYRTKAWPHEGFTAGPGWNLSLGRILPPASDLNDTPLWVYVSKDGASHSFYPTLHVGDPADARFYTRDGSYLRMRTPGALRIIEFPDGTEHTFEADPSGDFYRPTKFENRFGDAVTISYTATKWTISDPYRTQTVTFVDFDPLDDWAPKVVSEVSLKTFDGSNAVYSFSYTALDLVRACPHNDDELKSPLTLPVLSEVSRPDGTKFSMPDYIVPQTSLGCGSRSGRIRALELPTGGRLEWTYQTYTFPRREGPISLPPAATQAFETSVGVATRTFVNADGSVDGTWVYETALTPNFGGGGPGVPQSNELVNTVTDPLGNKTVSYFSVDLEGFAFTGDWSIYDYGLPFYPRPGHDPDGLEPRTRGRPLPLHEDLQFRRHPRAQQLCALRPGRPDWLPGPRGHPGHEQAPGGRAHGVPRRQREMDPDGDELLRRARPPPGRGADGELRRQPGQDHDHELQPGAQLRGGRLGQPRRHVPDRAAPEGATGGRDLRPLPHCAPPQRGGHQGPYPAHPGRRSSDPAGLERHSLPRAEVTREPHPGGSSSA